MSYSNSRPGILKALKFTIPAAAALAAAMLFAAPQAFAANAQQPYFGVTAAERVDPGETVSFEFAALRMDDVNLIEVTFELEGDALKLPETSLSGAGDFTALAGAKWTDLGGGVTQGKFAVGVLMPGTTASGSQTVAKLSFDSNMSGVEKLKITALKIYGIDWIDGKDKSSLRPTVIDPSEATVRVGEAPIGSPYDLNGDGKVDAADLAIAFYYYASNSGESNWNYAKIADVNASGAVDIADLTEIYSHFSK